MPQVALSPTLPESAAQRGRPWSVPRRRAMPSVTGTHNPSGTLPPSDWVSCTEKSTRKLAQQAPQAWHSLMAGEWLEVMRVGIRSLPWLAPSHVHAHLLEANGHARRRDYVPCAARRAKRPGVMACLALNARCMWA